MTRTITLESTNRTHIPALLDDDGWCFWSDQNIEFAGTNTPNENNILPLKKNNIHHFKRGSSFYVKGEVGTKIFLGPFDTVTKMQEHCCIAKKATLQKDVPKVITHDRNSHNIQVTAILEGSFVPIAVEYISNSQFSITSSYTGLHEMTICFAPSLVSFLYTNGGTLLTQVNTETLSITQQVDMGDRIGANYLDDILYISTNGGEIVRFNPFTFENLGPWMQGIANDIYLFNDYEHLYAISYSQKTLTKINIDTASIATTVTTGKNPTGLCFDHDTDIIYVACYGNSRIDIFDKGTLGNIGSVSIPGPWFPIIADNFVYVSSYSKGRIYKIDKSNNSVVGFINVGSYPGQIIRVHEKLFVVCYGSNTVDVIDTNTFTRTNQISCPGGPRGISEAYGKIYVCCYAGHDIKIIDTKTETLLSESITDIGTNPTLAIVF